MNWNKARIVLLVADVAAVAAAVVLTRRLRELEKQAWFWTPEWLAGEAQADRDLHEGRFERYYDHEDFMKSLMAEPTLAEEHHRVGA